MNTQRGTILDSELRDAGGGGYLGEGFCDFAKKKTITCCELDICLFW